MTPPRVSTVLDLIGNTPMLELNQIRSHLDLQGRLLAKLEHLNPGGSKKDRVALSMVRHARASGQLRPGQAVVEVTSGNTGTGLAIVCRALGHPFYAVMSEGNTRERAQMMRALGAEVVLVPQVSGGVPGRVSGCDMRQVKDRAAQLVQACDAFFVDQFENPANPLAHELTTAEELWTQAEGKLDVLVAFVGSGGALAGLARGLRKFQPDLRVYVVEPTSASSLASRCCSDLGHAIQGGGYGRSNLSLLDGVAIDGYLSCTDAQATDAARLLAAHEGILAGYSTGAQLHAAIELLRSRERDATIGFLVCDTGMKYFSTELYA
ncbi:MAG: PLP-dependent cysteine synthase family protein [Tepidisphaeraceae bacterium]